MNRDSDKPLPYGPILVFTCFLVVVDLAFHVQLKSIDWGMLLQYVTVMRWPIVVLLVLYLLRERVPSLVDRIRKVNVGQIGAELDPSTQEEKSETIKETDVSLREIDQEQLSQIEGGAIRAADNQAQRELLVKSIELEFERIFRTIFGTQIQSLERLRAYAAGLPQSALSDLVAQHQKLANPNSAYSTPIDFMSYPVSVGLAEFDPVPQTYKLTVKGSVFLGYMTSQGLLGVLRPL